MKNTGIIYESTEQTPATAPAFAGLLPPLSDEQCAALEADILQNGCYSPIIVNENTVIIDGYHRYEICEKHGITFIGPSAKLIDKMGNKSEARNTMMKVCY